MEISNDNLTQLLLFILRMTLMLIRWYETTRKFNFVEIQKHILKLDTENRCLILGNPSYHPHFPTAAAPPLTDIDDGGVIG